MKFLKLHLLFIAIFLGQIPLRSQMNLSPKIASYDIDLELDVNEKKVKAKQKLYWKNPGTSPVNELQFHLYYNAFKNTESTFMRDRGVFDGLLGDALKKGCNWAKMDIISIEDNLGNDLTKRMNFIQP